MSIYYFPFSRQAETIDMARVPLNLSLSVDVSVA